MKTTDILEKMADISVVEDLVDQLKNDVYRHFYNDTGREALTQLAEYITRQLAATANDGEVGNQRRRMR